MYEVKLVVLKDEVKYCVYADNVRVSQLFCDRDSAKAYAHLLADEDKQLKEKDNKVVFKDTLLTIDRFFEKMTIAVANNTECNLKGATVAIAFADIINDAAERLFGEEELDKYMHELEKKLRA